MRILAIAPYENLKQRIDTLSSQYPELEVDTYVGDLHDGVKIVEKLGKSYDLILSRGGTAQQIKKNTHLPVIEIEISILDILRTIKLVENYTQRYAFIGFSNITKQVQILAEILEKSLDIITIEHRDELPEIFKTLMTNDYTLVIGDKVTTTYAAEVNLNSILLESGTESITSALDLTVTLGKSLACEQQKNQDLQLAQKYLGFSLVILGRQLQIKSIETLENRQKICTLVTNVVKREKLLEERPVTFFQKYYGKLYRITLAMSKTEIIASVNEVQISESTGAIRLISENDSIKNSSVFIGDTQKMVSEGINSGLNILLKGEVGTGKNQLMQVIVRKLKYENNWMIQLDQLSEEEWIWLLESEESVFLNDQTLILLSGIESLSKSKLHQLLIFIQETDYINHLWIGCYSTKKENNNLEVIKKEHLFYQIDLSPLRKRLDELSSITSLYLYEFNTVLNKNVLGFVPAAFARMQQFSWPENLKQLRKVCRELVIYSNSSMISEKMVIEALAKEKQSIILEESSKKTLIESLEDLTLNEIQKRIIEEMLYKNHGNKTKTAETLGIGRSTLWRMLKD
ncbi:PrpR N-terminal domain-containing protein [Enterococcus sp. AZ103]|uniref:PrpR N-terminal domain-containing protein n=1 Tax=Enterococcus sp. AZ103 TaxID=2774628 RepID=UPI003F28EAEF